MSETELENQILKNNLRDYDGFIEKYKKQMNIICVLKGTISDLKDKYSKEIKVYKRENEVLKKALREV
jgi:hypothetical protein